MHHSAPPSRSAELSASAPLDIGATLAAELEKLRAPHPARARIAVGSGQRGSPISRRSSRRSSNNSAPRAHSLSSSPRWAATAARHRKASAKSSHLRDHRGRDGRAVHDARSPRSRRDGRLAFRSFAARPRSPRWHRCSSTDQAAPDSSELLGAGFEMCVIGLGKRTAQPRCISRTQFGYEARDPQHGGRLCKRPGSGRRAILETKFHDTARLLVLRGGKMETARTPCAPRPARSCRCGPSTRSIC